MLGGLPIEAGEMTGYYYKSLVYLKLCRFNQLKKLYGEGVMAVIVEQFSKRSFRLSGMIIDANGFMQTA